ncbi:MAG: hypothetical protein ACR2PH_01665 [Desulfobulbia bacterium]
MLKVAPHPDYPPEEVRYVRVNDASPVAVAIILNRDADKIPPEIEILVRTGIESGAALSGTIQAENIGFEKVDCNIVTIPVIDLERAIKGDALRICRSEQNDRYVSHDGKLLSRVLSNAICGGSREKLQIVANERPAALD